MIVGLKDQIQIGFARVLDRDIRSQRKKPLERPRQRWEDKNNRVDTGEIRCEDVCWTQLAQNHGSL